MMACHPVSSYTFFSQKSKNYLLFHQTQMHSHHYSPFIFGASRASWRRSLSHYHQTSNPPSSSNPDPAPKPSIIVEPRTNARTQQLSWTQQLAQTQQLFRTQQLAWTQQLSLKLALDDPGECWYIYIYILCLFSEILGLLA